ncbi:hypothetical protein RCM33_03610 [Escherichia marmotae]|nr:hypothetical protein [Escherichia marmotae]
MFLRLNNLNVFRWGTISGLLCLYAGQPVSADTFYYCPVKLEMSWTYVNGSGGVSPITAATSDTTECPETSIEAKPFKVEHSVNSVLSPSGAPTSSYPAMRGSGLLPLVEGEQLYLPATLGFDWVYTSNNKAVIQGASITSADSKMLPVLKDLRSEYGKAWAGYPFRATYHAGVPKALAYTTVDEGPEIIRTMELDYTSYYNNSSLHEGFQGRVTVTYQRVRAIPLLRLDRDNLSCQGNLSCQVSGTAYVRQRNPSGSGDITGRLYVATDNDVTVQAERGSVTEGGVIGTEGLIVRLGVQENPIRLTYTINGKEFGEFVKTVNFTLSID